MKEQNDLLQERLERLEAGDSLEACLVGLPPPEAELLKLATGLSKMRYPEYDSNLVAAQRTRLMDLARKKQWPPSRPFPGIRGILTRPNWLRPVVAYAGAAALVIVVVVLALVWSRVFQSSPQEARVAQIDTAVPTPDSEPQGTGVAQHGSSLPTPDSEIALVPTEPNLSSSNTIFIPSVACSENRLPHNAMLKDVQGLVEVQVDGENWERAQGEQTVLVEQRIRTGPLSGARLLFYDDSQAHLGSDTEVSVDELGAHPADQSRIVVLTQWGGQTDNDVTPTASANARYEIRTPSGIGEAKGTSFQVHVSTDLQTRFSVDEGAVAVTGLNVTVLVRAGQLTTVTPHQAPSDPVFRITGEGEVSQIGATWIIAGQSFATHDGTVIVGNPQPGDWVSIDGHLSPDGERVADYIALERRALVNRFSITGQVDAIGDTAWTVEGQTITVNDETRIQDDIQTGDIVQVEGVVLPTGTFLAQSIRLVEETPRPFNFIGVVQHITGDTWTISGVDVTVSAETEVDAGLGVGNVVQVSGEILDDEVWQAHTIERFQDQDSTFTFTGRVESIAPWIVSGISFETDEWTQTDPSIEIGDRVRVKGQVLQDGTWLATQIEQLSDDDDDDDDGIRVTFRGTVASMDPWVVSGISLLVNEDTTISRGIEVGDLVKVKAEILPNGSWRARRIIRIGAQRRLGCFVVSTAVTRAISDRIELPNWPELYVDDAVITGDMRLNSIITILLCIDRDGNITVVSIVVVDNPPPVIIAPPPQQPPRPPHHGDDDDHDDHDDDDDDHDDDDDDDHDDDD